MKMACRVTHDAVESLFSTSCNMQLVNVYITKLIHDKSRIVFFFKMIIEQSSLCKGMVTGVNLCVTYLSSSNDCLRNNAI